MPKSHIAWNKGKKLSIDHRKNLSLSHIGKPSGAKGRKLTDEQRSVISENRKGKMIGKSHAAWKSNNVGYRCLHSWVQRKMGKAKICSNCGSTGGKKRGCHWANISGLYKRNVSDWHSLCPKCNANDGVSTAKRFFIKKGAL